MSDEPRSAHSIEVSGPSLKSRTDGLIGDNKGIIVEMIAEGVHGSVGTVHNVIQNYLTVL